MNVENQSLANARVVHEFMMFIDTTLRGMGWRKTVLVDERKNYWEVLFYLYIQPNDDYVNRTKSACVANMGGMPKNTAARHIENLIRLGALQETKNPVDKRSKIIYLTDDVRKSFDDFFTSFNFSFEQVGNNSNSSME